MTGLFLLSCEMVTFLSLFFWSSKVQVTCSSFDRLGSSWDNLLVMEKKRIFLTWQISVFRLDGAR